jgi:hypothetical protein
MAAEEGFDVGSGFGYARQGSSAIEVSNCSRSFGVGILSTGGFIPATCTLEKKPCFCRPRHSRRWRFVKGIEVRPNLAFDAF